MNLRRVCSLTPLLLLVTLRLAKSEDTKASVGSYTSPLKGWKTSEVEQLVDHFEGREAGVFMQRCRWLDQFHDPKRPMAFVSVGSMDTGSSYDITGMAQRAKALIFLIEDRFIGSSLPTNDFSVRNLKRLYTIEQRVEDIAYFGSRLQEQTPDMKIIVVGCSATGLIAALVREKHPDIFIGAVASATPIKFMLMDDMYTRLESKDLSRSTLGGSPQCLAAITKAHEDLQKAMSTAQGRRETENKFRFCPGVLENVTNQMYITIPGDLLGTAIQYNDPTCTKDYCNIKRICNRFATGSEPVLDKLADIYNTNKPEPPGVCRRELIVDWIGDLRDEKSASKGRLDTFFVCNSRGLLPECKQGSCPYYTRGSWVDFWLMICREGFGLSKDDILKSLRSTQEYVGGNLHGATNILLINGDADPWYSTFITKGRAGLDVLKVKDEAHCSWCSRPILPVIDAASRVVAKWLNDRAAEA